MRVVLLALTVAAVSATPAFAQRPRPIPIAAIDLRGFTTSLGQDDVTATDLKVAASELPSRAFGVSVGGQVYVLRRPRWALGLGADLLRGSASAQKAATSTTPAGPAIVQKIEGMAGFVTFNFGDYDGWSYVGAGMGPLRLQAYTGEPAGAGAGKMTLSFGGGARWFRRSHVAFAFDLRFFQAKATVANATSAGRGAGRLLLMSVGVTVR